MNTHAYRIIATDPTAEWRMAVFDVEARNPADARLELAKEKQDDWPFVAKLVGLQTAKAENKQRLRRLLAPRRAGPRPVAQRYEEVQERIDRERWVERALHV